MRVLVTGAGGQVGAAVLVLLSQRPGAETFGLDHRALDIANRDGVEQAIADARPEVVINCAAMTNVDACETDPDAAFAANALGVRHLAVAAARLDAHVVHVSTDYVFDGESNRPYDEWDAVHPISQYGRSKLGGETELAQHAPSWTNVRTSWVFGRRGRDFVSWVLNAAEHGDLTGLIDDQASCPTYAADLAQLLVRFAVERRPGTFHVSNAHPCTRYEFGCAALQLRGIDTSSIKRLATGDLPRPAARPVFSALDNRALRLQGVPALRPWRDALREYLGEGLGAST